MFFLFLLLKKKVLLYRKCCDTNYECCLFSVIYLRLTWCRNTLIFISGVVCKPKLTCSVFGTVYRMLCVVFPVFAVWLSVHSILVSMNFPLKEPMEDGVIQRSLSQLCPCFSRPMQPNAFGPLHLLRDDCKSHTYTLHK